MTIPFSTEVPAHPGMRGLRATSAGPRLSRFWLGPPGQLMQLPGPDLGYDITRSRGRNPHQLANGGAGMTLRRRTFGQWVLKWSRSLAGDWQVIRAFDEGVFGDGPFCYLPPEDKNRLDQATSLCGADDGDITGWAVTGGTLEADDGAVSPITPCGVLRWIGAGSGKYLVAGSLLAGAPVVDPDSAVPYLPAASLSNSARVRTSTGTASVSVVAAGFDVNGALVSSTVLTTVTVGSSDWMPLAISAAPGALGSAVFVTLMLKSNSASAPDIWVSTPQLECWSTATDWEPGCGSPRVLIGAETPRSIVDGSFGSSTQLTLTEG